MQKTDPRYLLIQIAKILKALKIPYLVTGGMAVFVWGRPRFTADIDIVVELDWGEIDNLEKALMALGKFGYVDKGAMQEAMRQKGEFNFIDGNTGVKVDFWVLNKSDPLDVLRLKRKVARKVLGKIIYFISPEDLILSKLKWYQMGKLTRQVEDIESVLKISGEKLDMQYIKNWAKKINAREIFNKIIEKQ